jgi:pSer/pThr/pTyr-binding forkhead associated (FHA) protein
MVQLNVLVGNRAGSQSLVRQFPFRIGRAADNDLQLGDAGVWDQHLSLVFQNGGFNLVVAPNALVAVNSEPFQNQILRNGDIITVGSAKLQFWLAATRLRALRVRELFAWTLIIAVLAAQFGLIYWLLR